MEHDAEQKLAKIIGEELRRLPDLQAPRTLIPRVLSLLASRALPWWKHPWLEWPIQFRAVSFVLATILAAVPIYFATFAFESFAAPSFLLEIQNRFAWLSVLSETLMTLGNAIVIASRALGQPVVLAAVGAFLFMYFVCVGLGTACFRLVMVKR